jgi:hypothetical protein
MRTDGEIERLSEMLADSIAAAATKKGPRHVPLAALREGYITFSSTWKGAMTGLGTSRTSRDVRLESAKWAKADIDQVAVTDRHFMSTRPNSFSVCSFSPSGLQRRMARSAFRTTFHI